MNFILIVSFLIQIYLVQSIIVEEQLLINSNLPAEICNSSLSNENGRDYLLIHYTSKSFVLEPRTPPIPGRPSKKPMPSEFDFFVGGICFSEMNPLLSVTSGSNISSAMSCAICSKDLEKVETFFYWRIPSRKKTNSASTSRVKVIRSSTNNCTQFDLDLFNIFPNDTGAIECLINITNNLTRQHLNEFRATRELQVHLLPQVSIDPLPEVVNHGEELLVTCLVEINSPVEEILTVVIGSSRDSYTLPPEADPICQRASEGRTGSVVFRVANSQHLEFYLGGWSNVCANDFSEKVAAGFCATLGIPNNQPLITRMFYMTTDTGHQCIHMGEHSFNCYKTISCSSGWIGINCAARQYRIDRDVPFTTYFNSSMVICSDVGNINVYCRAKNQLGLYTETSESVTIQNFSKMENCDAGKDEFGKWWQLTPINQKSLSNCPNEMEGSSERFCNSNRKWNRSDYSGCVRIAIKKLLEHMTDWQSITSNSTAILNNLNDAVNTSSWPLLPGDLENIMTILNLAKRDIGTEVEEISKVFIDIASKILHQNSLTSWEKLPENVAVSMMKVLEDFGYEIAKKSKTDLSVITENIEFAIRKIPSGQRVYSLNQNSYRIDLSEGFIQSIKNDSPITLSSLYYASLANILPVHPDHRIASGILSLSLYPKPNQTWRNLVSMQYKNLLVPSSLEPFCKYWNFSHNSTDGGWWYSNGCKVVKHRSGDDSVQCICDHMTNFAILMGTTVSSFHNELLGMLTIFGCSISIFCLLVTIVTHLWIWKYVSSIRTVLLLNLCASLLLAMLVFVAGIIQTEHVIACKVIAVLLHYLYLTVFSFMFCHGLLLYMLTVQVFNSGINFNWHFIVLGWGLPLIIVGVTLGARQTEGYGTKEYCWLSKENGMIYSFIIPVALVILVNLIFITMALKSLIRSAGIQSDTDKEKIKSVLWSICLLLPLLGFTWAFGLLAIIDETLIFHYLFVICNSFQGVLIFAFYCLRNPRIQQCLRDMCKNKDKPALSKGKYTLTKISADSATNSSRKKSTSDVFSQNSR